MSLIYVFEHVEMHQGSDASPLCLPLPSLAIAGMSKQCVSSLLLLEFLLWVPKTSCPEKDSTCHHSYLVQLSHPQLHQAAFGATMHYKFIPLHWRALKSHLWKIAQCDLPIWCKADESLQGGPWPTCGIQGSLGISCFLVYFSNYLSFII